MLLDAEVQKPKTAGLDIRALLREHEGRNYELHHEHVNPRMSARSRPSVLTAVIPAPKDLTSGTSRESSTWTCCPATACSVWAGIIRKSARVLTEFLGLNYPSLVKMEAPLLSGLLAAELKKRMPNQLDTVFFHNSGAEGIETALKYAKCATGRPALLYCQKAFSWVDQRRPFREWR